MATASIPIGGQKKKFTGNGWLPTGTDSAKAPLGYGLPNVTTIATHSTTTYFRKTIRFGKNNPAYSTYRLRVKRDDGVVVYINGQEVFRDNLNSPHPYNSTTPAAGDNGSGYQEIYLDGHILKKDSNVVAVEVHQYLLPNDSDLYFDLELAAYTFLQFTQTEIVEANSNWRYLDDNTVPVNWKAAYPIFDDEDWKQGLAELGYGDNDEKTIVNSGPSGNHFISTYFRKTFNLSSIHNYYKLRMKRDDGIVVYFNGTEVFRDNISGVVTASTVADTAVLDDARSWIEVILKNSNANLTTGNNTIAAEIHQATPGSSDISFNFELIGMDSSSVYITRGPYLQMCVLEAVQLDSKVEIHWQTNVPTKGILRAGSSPKDMYAEILDYPSINTPSIDHTVYVNPTAFNPGDNLFYGIGTPSLTLQNTSDNQLKLPLTFTRKTRILTMGDLGEGDQNQRTVMDKFMEYVQDSYIDLFLPLGDIAYKTTGDPVESDGGTDLGFQKNFFQMYQNDRLMKQTPIYPTVGNHEYYNLGNTVIDFTNFNRPYYSIFNMPTQGQGGGIASGTERYYSFNYSNIHFISLDDFGLEAPVPSHGEHFSKFPDHAYLWDSTNVQKDWLIKDLAANTHKWTIVYMHAPIYAKGSHDSDGPDNDWYLPLIRKALVPIFEKYHVDLVLTGHSHSYERSKLIKGNYGLSSDYTSANEVSDSNGSFDGTDNSCPYFKNASQTNGVVYVVAGSGGEVKENNNVTNNIKDFPNKAMKGSSNQINSGALYLEIDENQLDAKWIADDGNVKDRFTIMKDVNVTTNLIVQEGVPTTLKAPWSNGGFTWTNSTLTTQSISVTPPANAVTVYTVKDSHQCVTNVFNVRVISNDCASAYIINYDINPPSVLTYKTNGIIIDNKAITSGAKVNFKAEKSISLNAGFKADSGSIFTAYIDGCGNLRRSDTWSIIDKDMNKHQLLSPRKPLKLY